MYYPGRTQRFIVDLVKDKKVEAYRTTRKIRHTLRLKSHLTVGVALFGSNVSDRLSSSREVLPGSRRISLV